MIKTGSLKYFYCALVSLLILFVLSSISSFGFAATPPRMRPYTGVGLLIFAQSDKDQAHGLQLQLYEEPGLSRIRILNDSRLSGNEWIFSLPERTSPLIVSARKGDWLRVAYDDAGREAWVNPEKAGSFQSWEQFLSQQACHILNGLPSQYYKLLHHTDGELLTILSPKQIFKVLKIEDDWGMVLTDQQLLGWLRWRDEDGRLLVGTNP